MARGQPGVHVALGDLTGPLMSYLCLIETFTLWGGSRVGSRLEEDPWEGIG